MRQHRIAGGAGGDHAVRGAEIGGEPGAENGQPDRRGGGADIHVPDQRAPPAPTRKISRIIRYIWRIGDIIGGAGGELRGKGHPGEMRMRRGAGRDMAEQDGAGYDEIERQADPEQRPEDDVQPVMAENGDGRRHHPQPQRHGGDVPAEEMVQPLADQHRIHHIEAGEGEQRAHQRNDDAAIAELRAGLDHLRQAEIRPLAGMEGHEQRAE